MPPPQAVSFVLKFSEDNGATWKKIAGPVTGDTYNWTAPAPRGDKPKCLVKVIGYDTSGTQVVGKDKSDSPFTVKTVKLTSPDGGAPLRSKAPLSIKWTIYETFRPITRIRFCYTKNGGTTWSPIGTLQNGSYPPGNYNHSVTVPLVKTPKTGCKVKVALEDSRGVNRGSDASDNCFTVDP